MRFHWQSRTSGQHPRGERSTSNAQLETFKHRARGLAADAPPRWVGGAPTMTGLPRKPGFPITEKVNRKSGLWQNRAQTEKSEGGVLQPNTRVHARRFAAFAPHRSGARFCCAGAHVCPWTASAYPCSEAGGQCAPDRGEERVHIKMGDHAVHRQAGCHFRDDEPRLGLSREMRPLQDAGWGTRAAQKRST